MVVVVVAVVRSHDGASVVLAQGWSGQNGIAVSGSKHPWLENCSPHLS